MFRNYCATLRVFAKIASNLSDSLPPLAGITFHLNFELMERSFQIHDMRDLLDLPTTFLIGLLTDWLDLDSLLAVDSACCSAASRKAYLDVVGSNVFCLRHAPYPRALETEGMRWLVAINIRVSHVWIDGSSDVDVAATAAFLHVSGGSLKTVWMTEVKDLVTSNAILELLSLTARQLDTLVLDGCDHVGGAVLRVLLTSCAKCLRCLRLSGCSLTASLSVPTLPFLHKLDINSCAGLDLSTLCEMVSASPSLRSFSCSNLFGSEACLDALAPHCPHLQVLAYERGDSTDVSSLVRLLQACPGIEVVDISSEEEGGNSSATDAHIAAIMQHCRKLKAFCGAASGPNITDASVMAVASRLEDLRNLWLSDIAFQSDQPMLALSEHCRNLTTLSLHAKGAILSENALVAFVGNLHSIVELCMEHFEMTDPVLAAIAAYCPRLQILDLYNCEGYTEVGIAALARGCTALKKVRVQEVHPLITPLVRLLWQLARPGVKFSHNEKMTNIRSRIYDFSIAEVVI